MSKAQPAKVLSVCRSCGVRFPIWPSQLKFSGAKFCSRRCYGKSMCVPLIDRFFRHVGHKTPTGCILWAGGSQKGGYGVIKAEGERRQLKASHVAYELFVGPVPPGLHVLHRCDNPPCVNPTHLFVGTRSDNMRDMLSKGRGGSKRVPGSRRYLRELRRQLKTP